MMILLKWLPFLSKLSFFSKFLAFIPGGQIFALVGGVAGAIINAITWLIKWLMDDILCAVEKPQRAIVRLAFGLGILAFGWTLGFDVAKDRVESARLAQRIAVKERDVARAENAQWRERHAEQEDRAKKAEVARAEAEARTRAIVAQRVRQPGAGAAPAAAKKATEPGVWQGLFTNPK